MPTHAPVLTHPKVDAFLNKATRWKAEMIELRKIVLACGFTEELKWYQPCYAYEGTNLVVISAFKPHCALNLFKGALLNDPEGILVKPGENSQSSRQIRFTSVAQIVRMAPVLKAYLKETIEAEKAGLKVRLKPTSDYPVPDELKAKFAASPAFEQAFRALTPGRQRGYLLHFSAAKQSATRTSRIEKYVPQIFAGKGYQD